MTKKKIISFIILGLFIVTAFSFTACGKKEPYIKSKKITSSTSTSASVEVVVKNDTSDDYYVTVTARVKFQAGWTTSGTSGGTGQNQAYGFVNAKSQETFNIGVSSPGTAGTGKSSIESVSLTYSKVEPMQNILDAHLVGGYLSRIVYHFTSEDVQNYIIGWRGPQISGGRIPFLIYNKLEDYGPTLAQYDYATVDEEEFVLTYYDTNRIFIYTPGVVVNGGISNEHVESWWSATWRTSGNGSLTADDIIAIKNALPTKRIVLE